MRIVFELPEALGNIRTEFLHIERKCVRHVYSTLHARNRLRIIITDQRASTLQYVTTPPLCSLFAAELMTYQATYRGS